MTFVDASGKRLAVLLPILLCACLAAHGQTASPDLQTYRIEATVPLAQIGATPAPMLPVNVVQAVQGGALEIRHSVVFTASTRRVSVRTFLVAPGSPNPTPAAAQTMVHESYEVNVENILWAPQVVVPPGSTPTSLVITGRVAGGSQSLFGDLANKLFVHSVGIGTGTATATRFNNVTTLISGMYTMYAGEATGSLAIGTGGTSGPGPVDPAAPTVVATAGMNSTTILPEIQLDASGSTDPGGRALTFAWRVVGKSAAVIGQNTAKPSVQFGEGFGEYIFEVTVTSASGLSSTGQVKVLYVGR